MIGHHLLISALGFPSALLFPAPAPPPYKAAHGRA
jgi:hypothetical protein